MLCSPVSQRGRVLKLPDKAESLVNRGGDAGGDSIVRAQAAGTSQDGRGEGGGLL